MSSLWRILATVLLSAALAACGTTGGTDAGAIVEDGGSSGGLDAGVPDAALVTTPVASVHVLPEDGRDFLVDAIDGATTGVDVALYILSDDRVIDALEAAARRGVPVRAILDQDLTINNEARTRLRNAGADVRDAPTRFEHFHQKSITVDDAMAFVMTLNVSYSAFTSNRDYAVKLTSRQELDVINTLFEADFSGAGNPAVASPMVISPNNARARLLALINSARTSILLTLETFADEGLRTALVARKDAGITVRIVLADPADVDQNEEDAFELRQRGFNVRFLRSPTMHAKMILVDDAVAYVGSINLTRTSLDSNREVGVITRDAPVVERIRTVAEQDWANATAP